MQSAYHQWFAKAGVLEGKRATVFPDQGVINELEQNGATYVDQSVVVSDKVVTGRDTASAEEVALKISSLLAILLPVM
ncbi:MAG: DJ-1/PfpI family protein [archaeon]|nr:DJ-1/PfpI family protein [archaeon]